MDRWRPSTNQMESAAGERDDTQDQTEVWVPGRVLDRPAQRQMEDRDPEPAEDPSDALWRIAPRHPAAQRQDPDRAPARSLQFRLRKAGARRWFLALLPDQTRRDAEADAEGAVRLGRGQRRHIRRPLPQRGG